MQITTSPGFDALAFGRPDLRAVDRLEAELLKMPQANIKTEHRFPAGTVFVFKADAATAVSINFSGYLTTA